MSETINEMFGCGRESDNDIIIDNYDDSPSDISLLCDITIDCGSCTCSEHDDSNITSQTLPVGVT